MDGSNEGGYRNRISNKYAEGVFFSQLCSYMKIARNFANAESFQVEDTKATDKNLIIRKIQSLIGLVSISYSSTFFLLSCLSSFHFFSFSTKGKLFRCYPQPNVHSNVRIKVIFSCPHFSGWGQCLPYFHVSKKGTKGRGRDE